MLTSTVLLALVLNLPPAIDDPQAPPVGPGGAVATTPSRPADRNTLSVRLENDVVGGRDGNYSSGASVTLTRENQGLLGGIWRRVGAGEGRLISGYELGQVIVTPTDISKAIPDPADRPYAGLLFLALSTQHIQGDSFQGLKLLAGVVGPASLAAQTQRLVHEWTGSMMPEGWDHQLKNEAVLNLVYERRGRATFYDSGTGWSAQAIPRGGAMVGNLLTQVQAGVQARIGYNVPDDFGKTLMRGLGNLPFPAPRKEAASRRFGAYVFAGGGGNLVARNLTLDGNTFRDGPRVDKKPAFAAGEVGVSLWTRGFEATLSFVFWGREYEGQTEVSRFGAATFGFRF